MKRVEFFTSRVAGKSVLDLGVVQHKPESHELDNWLHRHVADVASGIVGIDNDQEGISHLRRAGYDVELADAQSLDLGTRFDMVVAGDIVEHLDDTAGFFDGVRRHLNAQGQLLIATANPWFWLRLIRAVIGGVDENPTHTAWYTPQTLGVLLARHDFRVVHVEYGSSEEWLYRLRFLPARIRHTGFFVVAEDART